MLFFKRRELAAFLHPSWSNPGVGRGDGDGDDRGAVAGAMFLSGEGRWGCVHMWRSGPWAGPRAAGPHQQERRQASRSGGGSSVDGNMVMC